MWTANAGGFEYIFAQWCVSRVSKRSAAAADTAQRTPAETEFDFSARIFKEDYIMQTANRMQGVSGSAIRELFKLLGDPNIISFGGGNPAKECFPKEEIRTITDELLRDKSDTLLQYGAPEGYLPLRRAYLDSILPDSGLHGELDNVLSLTGSMQGLDLICKTVINPGDVVLVEEPSFLGALQTFHVAQAKLVTVPLHPDGIHIDELEAVVREHKPVMFYTIPTFQNPTSWVSGVEVRRRIAELAAEFDMLVIEDDPYAALRFSGEKLPTIKSFDTIMLSF